MHSVIETPTFLRDAAQSGMSEEERTVMIRVIASDPTLGEVMPGTGGARKYGFRNAARGNPAAIV
jgi:hypothetical protein